MTSVNYLSLPELLFVAERAIGEVEVRDIGLLESALARSQASAFGEDAYPTFLEKAAAPAHSLAMNHALTDGNKRLSLAGLMAFLGINGLRLTMDNHHAYDLIIAIAEGELDSVAAIVDVLNGAVEPHLF